jgi:hypothetical protein
MKALRRLLPLQAANVCWTSKAATKRVSKYIVSPSSDYRKRKRSLRRRFRQKRSVDRRKI